MSNILEYKGYHAKIEYDVENHVLYGKIEGINDYIDFESDSPAEIEREFQLAVDDYLDFCKEVGKEPDKEYKGSFNVRISPELHRAAAISAMKKDVSLNNWVSQAIENQLNSIEKVGESIKDSTDNLIATTATTETQYLYKDTANVVKFRNSSPTIEYELKYN